MATIHFRFTFLENHKGHNLLYPLDSILTDRITRHKYDAANLAFRSNPSRSDPDWPGRDLVDPTQLDRILTRQGCVRPDSSWSGELMK